jgi:hypothetical protein
MGALGGSSPFGKVSRGVSTISVKRVVPSLRSTVPRLEQIEREKIEIGASRHHPEGEHEASLYGGEQEMLGAPSIAWAVEVLWWRGAQRGNSIG